jgi:hypothetical protein
MADDRKVNHRGPLIALLAVMLLLASGLYLVHELSDSARLQDCLLSGRTNCAPIHGPTD